MPTLAHSVVQADGSSPSRAMLFLHGILGTGANWRSFARRFVVEAPDVAAVLVDLRLHGRSVGFSPPHDLAACAHDLVALERALAVPVDAVLGHSFGGKVALTYAALRGGDLAQCVVVDSNPGPRPDGEGSETTLEILAALERAPKRVARREELVSALEREGVSASLARWLAMNLAAEPEGGFALRLDLDGVRALLDDYFRVDLWHTLEEPPGRVALHFVLGGLSTVMNEPARARLERARLAHPDRLSITRIDDAGHWVHVDQPEKMTAALVAVARAMGPRGER